jgi:protein-S-isoprenylcysteine O-methyltransferase Ste14
MFLRPIKSRIAVFFTMLLVAWTFVGGFVLAAEGEGTATEKAAESAAGPVWAVAYIVILLLVALGVFATIRGSKRRDRAKPEDYAATVNR